MKKSLFMLLTIVIVSIFAAMVSCTENSSLSTKQQKLSQDVTLGAIRAQITSHLKANFSHTFCWNSGEVSTEVLSGIAA